MVPSLLALTSSDEMNKNLLPALQHITTHFGLSSRTADILYLKISAILQGYYLYFYNSTLAEHYWGLTRSYLSPSSHSLRTTLSGEYCTLSSNYDVSQKLLRVFKMFGFLDTVLTPFLNRKLQVLHNDFYHGNDLNKIERIVARLYPYLNLGITTTSIVLKLAYYLKITEKHSIISYLLGLRYSSNRTTATTKLTIFRHLVEIAFPVAMFYVQFVKQWSSIEVCPYEATIKPPPPPRSHHDDKTWDVCTLCGGVFSIPTAVPTTGMVYCYVCIFTFVQREGNCPVSHLPIKTKDLVKLNLR